MKCGLLLSFVLLSCSRLLAQTMVREPFLADSSDTRPMQEVLVKAYDQNRKLVEVGAPVSVVGKATLNRFGNAGILPALNTIPGVRMEERSPGSYRLNIRGSSLRSPFGVRDVKIYWNEIPLTDPGGNTYLNELGFYNFQSIEVIKGTAGSLYGAGIGGAVLINSMPAVYRSGISMDLSTGSYNTQNINLNYRLGDDDHRSSISLSHQSSDGYRVQTQMRRDIASWEMKLKTGENQTLHAFMLFSDLLYQTPGALTLAEYMKDPRAARPAAGAFPSAAHAKAAIYQKNFTAGFSNEQKISEHWRNTTAVYGAYTDFTNPGIRVYEIRQEPHFGGRTVFEGKREFGSSKLQLDMGGEAQRGFFETRDYANRSGNPDTLQTDDHTGNWQYLIFAQADLQLRGGWTITAGASLNESSYQIRRLSTVPSVTDTTNFEKLAPRIAVLKMVLPGISLYTSAARGFSTPTVSEVEKSNGIIGPPLNPEDGIDYELGTRGSLFNNRLFFDVNAFFFHIRNAIVQRIDSGGVMYSVNAGGTDQHGLETYLSYQLTDNPKALFGNTRLWISHTWHDFHYRDFVQNGIGYSGNRLPSVPPQTVVAGVDIMTSAGFYTNFTYTYADRIALNDANTAFAHSYNLLGGRIGYRRIHKKNRIDLFVGGDNLFNEQYSLGNDINAAAGRYYNSAPGVNYYAGFSMDLNFRVQ